MTIIDVRNQDEFESGHIKDSINIPLQILSEHVEDIRSITRQPIIVYCATGTKSGMAANFLNAMGIDCENGGSMEYLTSKLSK